MEQDQVPLDQGKVQQLIDFLTKYLFTIQDYNSLRVDLQASIMKLYDFSKKDTISQAERESLNSIFKNAGVPDNLFL